MGTHLDIYLLRIADLLPGTLFSVRCVQLFRLGLLFHLFATPPGVT